MIRTIISQIKPTICVAVLMLSGCAQPLVDWQTTEQPNDLTDTDRDGVVALRDKCPKSQADMSVDNVGCGIETEILIRQELKIQYANNSSIIPPHAYDQIGEIAALMHERPDSQLTIEGHASKSGSKEYNLALSQKRAEAVITVLQNEFGIDHSRLTAIGYGFERPIDEGDDAIAHARNRRIVAILEASEQKIDRRWNIWTVGR